MEGSEKRDDLGMPRLAELLGLSEEGNQALLGVMLGQLGQDAAIAGAEMRRDQHRALNNDIGEQRVGGFLFLIVPEMKALSEFLDKMYAYHALDGRLPTMLRPLQLELKDWHDAIKAKERTSPEVSPERPPYVGCDGSSDCKAEIHIEGCLALRRRTMER
jgi:hypothetical protein